jgi:hypothetical protein
VIPNLVDAFAAIYGIRQKVTRQDSPLRVIPVPAHQSLSRLGFGSSNPARQTSFEPLQLMMKLRGSDNML